MMKPKVIVAKTAGFCFGVDRAVKIVYNKLDTKANAADNTEINTAMHVATLGPIIHNADVVADLVSKGVRIIDVPSELRNDELVIIRSHGVGLQVYKELPRERMVDATCPFVARIHRIVEKHTADGNFILIAGNENHPEIQGIVGHCETENYAVFADEYSLEEIIKKKAKY